MARGSNGCRRVAMALWAVTALAIVVWTFVPGYVVGWDLRVSTDAVHSMQRGQNPYTDGMAVLEEFQLHATSHPNSPIPLVYVYGPITLPLLRWVGSWPVWLSLASYWLLVVLGAAVAIRIGMRSIEDVEVPIFLLIAPAAIFFPGLVQNDALFSGNIAYILYGLVLGAAAVGWRKNQWGWFYGATLLAACFKAPMLTLLAIPLLSAQNQWVPAGLTAAAWLGQFAIQWFLWPVESHSYMRAINDMFVLSRDFSSSPAGMVAEALYGRVPYQPVIMGVYVLYAVPLVGILFYLSRRFLDGKISAERWIPVMLIGVIMLNPRIQEYDVAAITVALALVTWRCLSRGTSSRMAALRCAGVFVAINLLGAYRWRAAESVVMIAALSAGIFCLMTAAVSDDLAPEAALLAEAEVPA